MYIFDRLDRIRRGHATRRDLEIMTAYNLKVMARREQVELWEQHLVINGIPHSIQHEIKEEV